MSPGQREGIKIQNETMKHGIFPYSTKSFIYWARQQTAVARGLAWPARRFTGRQTAAARKHSLCF